MPNTPNLALPYPTPTNPADIPADIQALATSVDTKLGAAGTTLPATPTDGQEFYLFGDAGGNAIWHLRYRTGSAKWEFVGGSPLAGYDGSTITFNTSGAVVGGYTPTLTVPRAGVYRVNLKADLLPTVAGTVYLQADSARTPNASIFGAAFSGGQGGVSGASYGAIEIQGEATLQANDVIRAAGYATSVGMQLSNRFLLITPIRLT
jgi:hypothetical protein